MFEWQNFRVMASATMTTLYGVGWRKKFSLESVNFLLELKAKELFLVSLGHTKPVCPPEEIGTVMDRYTWAMNDISDLFNQVYQLREGEVPQFLVDDIHLRIMMIDRQMMAFELMWTSSTQAAS